VNREALDQLFTFWAPVSPNTLFDGVFELAPGTQMIVEAGAVRQRRYWEWDFAEPGQYVGGSETALVEQAHDLLLDATRIRLRADVPVGAYLSGGLDSSILSAIISRHEDASLRTFSIEFERDDLDESSYQRLMFEHLGVECTSVRCQETDIANALPDVVRHTEIPLLRTAPVPMSLLSGLVRSQNFKVVLTGEGADEVFGGYDLFKEVKLRQFWARNPESKFRPQLLQRLYPYLDIAKAQDNVYLKRFFGVGLEAPDQPLFSHLTRAANTSQCKVFFADDFRDGLRSDPLQALEETLPEAFSRWSPFNRAQFIEARSLMAGYLLSSQGDRMLMRNSVEGRFPYLDHRVIEFANSLDPRLKMKVLNEKYLLKKAFRNYLPKEIVGRYKQPYRAPDVPAFFSGTGHEYVRDMLCADAVDRAGIFDSGKVQRLVNKMARGGSISNRDNMSFVGVLSTQIWHEEFLSSSRAPNNITPATAAER
jgi:asparagine synthase (glutamine-hydrolysing)